MGVSIAGMPPRLPFRDEKLMASGMREGWLKMGGKEEIRWKSGYLVLYWEVRTEQDKHGRSWPQPYFVVEYSTGSSGSKLFNQLKDADAYFADLERENLIEIAASALGVDL